MIKRLWLLLSTAWTILNLLTAGSLKDPLWLFIIFMPWIVGYGLLLAVRFVLRGDPRKRVFQPPPQRYY